MCFSKPLFIKTQRMRLFFIFGDKRKTYNSKFKCAYVCDKAKT